MPATPQDRSSRIFWLVDIAVILYLVLDIIAQALPPHYDPINTAESLLAVGPYGYIMTINFLNRGLLSLGFLYAFTTTLRARGIDLKRYRTGVYLLSVWGVGALLLAAFPTDALGTSVSWHGLIHLVVAFFAFVGGTVGTLALSTQFAYARPLQGAGRFATPIAAITVLFLVLLFGLPFVTPHLASNIGGVTERVLIGAVLVWILYLSIYLGRRPASAG